MVGPYDGYARNAQSHRRVMRKHAAANDTIRTVHRMDKEVHRYATREWDAGLKIYDYSIAVRKMLEQERAYPYHQALIVSWDNTARRGEDGVVMINSSPNTFQAMLETVVESIADQPIEHRLVFLNAWNEWAEGNHLEPDLRFGLEWLRAVDNVIRGPR